ncbi:hypothetical protein DES45_10516 [Microvirga subterranea]|uniref:Uncharacterized protein n=1 Tax=Microvirga subterranea TaxID=186651 RepID=A0A370HK03_9HYPH|nr:hypothetical protein DES45_10516 [Microvirga subterranea]
MKVVADQDTKRIPGAAILGTDGDEAIHPTISELIPDRRGDLRPMGREG